MEARGGGRRNENHAIIVREGGDGTYRFYAPIRGSAEDQIANLSKWLAENAE